MSEPLKCGLASQHPPHLPASDMALFLDFDGTLVHFNPPDPDAPLVDDTLRTLLHSLHEATGGATAIISGRALDALEALFEPLRLRAAGEHGSAWRLHPHTEAEAIQRPLGLLALAEFCEELLASYPEVVLERKPYSLVLHFHTQPELRSELAEALTRACEATVGVKLLHARGMLEIKAEAVNKGAAVSRFMQHSPFKNRVPVFIGDDVSDEDAFLVVNQLGGVSVKVGDGPSHARYRLEDEDAVHEWLQGLIKQWRTPVDL